MMTGNINYPIENFWQFVHCHPWYGALVLICIFILLIILCIILFKVVNVLKTISNRINTFTIGGMSFSISDKSLKSTNLDALIQKAIAKMGEQKSAFERETWNLLRSSYLTDPYEDCQYAAVAATILSYSLAVELKSAKGTSYTAVMSEDNGNYYFSLYAQNAGVEFDDSKKIPQHFSSAAEIELFLSKH